MEAATRAAWVARDALEAERAHLRALARRLDEAAWAAEARRAEAADAAARAARTAARLIPATQTPYLRAVAGAVAQASRRAPAPAPAAPATATAAKP